MFYCCFSTCFNLLCECWDGFVHVVVLVNVWTNIQAATATNQPKDSYLLDFWLVAGSGFVWGPMKDMLFESLGSVPSRMSWCFQWSLMELGPRIFWRVFESDKNPLYIYIRSNRKSTKFGLGCLPLLRTAIGQSRQHQLQDHHSRLWEQQQMAICSMAHGRGGRAHRRLTKHNDSTNSTVCNPSSNKWSRSPWSSWDCCGGTLEACLKWLVIEGTE